MLVTNTTSSFPDNWEDLYLLHQPLDMDAFLQSDLFAAKRNAYMKQSITMILSGSISFMASMLLVTHILRSHECLSTTYHRLIFGLSAGDIISSFCYALSSTMAPKEISYIIPFASGNIATCDAQGFLAAFAGGVSLSYNFCICFYYLAIITYNKKYDYIRRKLEPWFHGNSILAPLVIGVTLLATNAYNGTTSGGACYIKPHDSPHCIGYEVGAIPDGYSIPCGRGGPYDGHAKFRDYVVYAGLFWGLIIAPVTISFTMVSMLRSVTSIEKKMQNYGVSALRFRTTTADPTTNGNAQQESRGFALKLKEMIGKYSCLTAGTSQMDHRRPCAGDPGCSDPERPSLTTKSNKMTSQKRAVLHMAFGYAGAWLLVWTPFCLNVVFWIVTKSYQDTLVILMACTLPLQGFFNFLVFMAPKVRTTRTLAIRRGRSKGNNNHNHQQHLTWCQAFYKAYMSRGRRLEDRKMRNKNRTERRITKAIFRKINETFPNLFERMKLFTTSETRTSSPEVTEETNKWCLESGERSAAASS